MQMSVRLSVCSVKSVLELTNFISSVSGLSYVCLRSASGLSLRWSLTYFVLLDHMFYQGNCALLSCISSKTSLDKTDLCWGLSGSRHFPSVSATCSFQAWDFETVMVGNSVARLEAQRVTTKIFFLEREERFPCESRLSSCFLP